MMLPEAGIVLDAGTGMFRIRDLIQTRKLDILLSHVHLDHSIGLTFLYDILYGKPDVRVTVHVAENKIETIQSHLYNQLLFPVKPNFEFSPITEKPNGRSALELECGARVTMFPVEHPGGCHGFRIDWPDRSLAYVTDTTAGEDASYIDAIRGVDTLIHECYFPDGWEERAAMTGHSCLTPVAKVAAAAEAGRLFLVHINPLDPSDSLLDLDLIREIFPNVEIPNDKTVIDV